MITARIHTADGVTDAINVGADFAATFGATMRNLENGSGAGRSFQIFHDKGVVEIAYDQVRHVEMFWSP